MADKPSGVNPDSRPNDGGASPVMTVLRTGSFRRVLVSFFVFNTTEWATWIAILIWAFDYGGAGAAGLIALVQLVPASIAAPFAGVLGDRMRRDRALALGYTIQGLSTVVVGVVLVLEMPVPVVYIAAAVATTSFVLTRPVHDAIIPELARTPAQITAGNSASSTAEGVGVFAGPLITGVLVAFFGPGSVFLVFGALSGVSVALTRSLPLQRTLQVDEDPEGLLKATVAGVGELIHDLGASMLVFIVGAQFVVVGLLDILSVELGVNILDMGPSGPGILTSALGVGALIGAALTVVLIGRRTLSPAILAGMLVTGIPIALISLATLPAVAWLLLACSGLGKAFVDVAGRTLMQRTVRETVISRIFGVQESFRMAGLAAGSVAAPVIIHVFGSRGAFVVTGLLLPGLGFIAWNWVRHLDSRALQPGPGFARLKAIPMFDILPQSELEQLSRDLIPLTAPAGSTIMVEGEPGDRFYVVDAGSLSIIQRGATISTTSAGGFFGEIALLRDIPRTATVRADEDVRLYALEREVFLRVVTGSSEVHELANAEADRRLDENHD